MVSTRLRVALSPDGTEDCLSQALNTELFTTTNTDNGTAKQQARVRLPPPDLQQQVTDHL